MYGVDGECRNCGENPEKVYRCQKCGVPEPLDGDQDDDESSDATLMADGSGLPEEFDEFVERAREKDTLTCRGCGDEVRRRYIYNGECVGCRNRVATDGGLNEDDLDDHTHDVGVPDGEGKDLGDAFAGADDARTARRELLDAVTKHADETEDGAPVGVVIDTALKRSGAHVGHVLRQCKLLLEQGDIYAPTNSTLRRTFTDGGRAEEIAIQCGAGVLAEDLQVGGVAATYRGPGPVDGGVSDGE